MNLETPRCKRCDWGRLFHVRRVRDATIGYDSRIGVYWHDRPVRVRQVDGAPRADGHFELLICRRCGWTAWYARDWEPPAFGAHPQHCDDCARATPHLRLPAVEHHGAGFEQPRITDGLIGREGFLLLTVCTRCGHARWSGRDYGHLEARHFVHYRLCEDSRACVSCGARAALIDDEARENDGCAIPIEVREEGLLARLLHRARRAGGFQLRLCRPCGAVEWYAQRLDELRATPGGDVALVGEEREMASVGGPYR